MNKSEWPQETKKKRKASKLEFNWSLVLEVGGLYNIMRVIYHTSNQRPSTYPYSLLFDHVHYKIGSLSIQMLNIVGDGMIFTIINFDFLGQN